MKKLPILLITIVLLLLPFGYTEANSDYYKRLLELQRQKEQYQAKLKELEGEERSLENEIAYLDNQIYLSKLEIEEAETEIKLLGEDIGDLSQRLERIASLLEFQEETFVARARSAYIADHLSPFDIALGSENLDEAIRRIKYLEILEAQDREVLEQMRDIKDNYNEQKNLLEDKKADVEELKRKVEAKKTDLTNQHSNREYLLVVTQNSESEYQKLLKQVESEIEIIRRVLAGLGEARGPVKKGAKIGRQGSTGCSTGTHLHFTLLINGVARNPASYLNSGTLGRPEDLSAPYFPTLAQYNSKGWSYWYNHGITQPFGARFTKYGSHNGIDMQANLWPNRGHGAPIYAAAKGYAYESVDWCGGRYVWIDHSPPHGSLPGYKTIYVHLLF